MYNGPFVNRVLDHNTKQMTRRRRCRIGYLLAPISVYIPVRARSANGMLCTQRTQ